MTKKGNVEKVLRGLKGITIERKIHRGWAEFDKIKDRLTKMGKEDMISYFGKYQYVYNSPKGMISLVKFNNYFKKGDNFWEIYCLRGNLFLETLRFLTKKKAEEEIWRLLK